MTSAFDASRSAAYDDRIVRMVPGYDVMHRLTDICLSSELPEDANVLMVGVGTGMEVLECGLRHPGWQITVVEPSSDMSAIAREKLKTNGLLDRVHWHEGLLNTLETQDTFDAATLLLVLHFVSNKEGEKLEILTDIANLLNSGGPLILSSLVGDPATTRTKKMFELGKAWTIAQGVDPKEAAEKFDLSRKDMFLVPEEKVKSLLRDAGYIDVQRILQGLAITTWLARTNR